MRSRLLSSFFALYFAALLFCFVRLCWPFFFYGYDWEPSDGDLLNAGMRFFRGLPMYGDWNRGDLHSMYTPLFSLCLGAFHALGWDALALGRVLNVTCMALAMVLCMRLVWKAGESETFKQLSVELRRVCAVLAGVAAIAHYELFEWSVNLRADPLLLLVSLAGALMLASWPRHPRLLAACVVLAFFAKQSGVGLGIAAILFSFIRRNDLSAKIFWTWTAGLAVALVAVFEIQSGGYFLSSVLFEPRRIFEAAMLKLWHAAGGLLGVWGRMYWMLPLTLMGLATQYRGALQGVVIFWGVDLALSFWLGRNIGGGGSYFWVHAFLSAAFAAMGLMKVCAWLTGRRISNAWIASLLLAALASIFYFHGRSLFKSGPKDLSHATLVSRRHAELVSSIHASDPEAKWASNRMSAAIVRAGALLDQEWCTLQIAARDPSGPIDLERVSARFRAGEYHYFQKTPGFCATQDRVFEAIRDCFKPIAQSEAVFLGMIWPVQILKFDAGLCKQ